MILRWDALGDWIFIMLCGFLCVGLALSAVLTPSKLRRDYQIRQVDAFVEIIERQLPGLVPTPEDRQLLRSSLLDLANVRTPPARFRPSALILDRPDERRFTARAEELADRAAAFVKAGDVEGYLRVLGEFYAEVGGYPGERAGQFIKSYLANVAFPIAPSVMVIAGLFMMAQPELCGAAPGDILDRVLIGAGAPLVALNGWVILRQRGRDWLAAIGDPVNDQNRGGVRVIERFWGRLSERVGEDLGPDHGIPARHVSRCDLALTQILPPRVSCPGAGCTAH